MTADRGSAPARATPSATMRATLGILLPELSRSGGRFWDHPDLAALYPRYLVALHTVIRASVPLMRDALAMTRERYGDTPYGPPLAGYLEKHIGEEMWH